VLLLVAVVLGFLLSGLVLVDTGDRETPSGLADAVSSFAALFGAASFIGLLVGLVRRRWISYPFAMLSSMCFAVFGVVDVGLIGVERLLVEIAYFVLLAGVFGVLWLFDALDE
jgi:hypothetical protein